jgi:hypothetical protein
MPAAYESEDFFASPLELELLLEPELSDEPLDDESPDDDEDDDSDEPSFAGFFPLRP